MIIRRANVKKVIPMTIFQFVYQMFVPLWYFSTFFLGQQNPKIRYFLDARPPSKPSQSAQTF